MNPSTPTVGLVVLNWNGWEDTRECLESLARLTHEPTLCYAVDNGSTDGSPDHLQAAFPEVRLVCLPANRGFGGGMNVGIRRALQDGCDYVLCLNNDMTAEPDLLERLLEAAADGVVPYPAIHMDADPERLDALGQRIDLYTGLTRTVGHGETRLPAAIEVDYTEVPLLPRDLLEVLGGWSEDYFAFYEDTDLGLRIRQAGWHLTCVPKARVYHKRGRTATRVPGLISYYSLRNRLLVVRRHGTPWHYATTLLHVFLLTLPYLALRCALDASYKHSLRHVLLGLADGLLPWRRGTARTWEIGPAPSPGSTRRPARPEPPVGAVVPSGQGGRPRGSDRRPMPRVVPPTALYALSTLGMSPWKFVM